MSSRVSFDSVTLRHWIPEKGTLDHYCECLSRLALRSPPATEEAKSKQCFMHIIAVVSRDWCLLEWAGSEPRAPASPPGSKEEEPGSCGPPECRQRGKRSGVLSGHLRGEEREGHLPDLREPEWTLRLAPLHKGSVAYITDFISR